jgi:glycerol-3-phosphate O-acyltransferase
MAAPVSHMLTANRLKDGDVLYWKGDGWVLSLAEGDVFADEAAAQAALAAAQKYVASNQVVAPYLFEVRIENGAIRPVKEREIIRAAGPTVRRDLGKQALHG